MLKKVNRLRKRQEFKKAYQRGKIVKNRNFVLYYAPNVLGTARIGFSVSKKIGKAVIRNKVKRKLREASRSQITHFAKGYDYIFIARQPILTESVAAMQKQIAGKLEELSLKQRYKKNNKQKSVIPKL